MKVLVRCLALGAFFYQWTLGQDPKPAWISHFKPTVEFRTWLEARKGPAFGLQPDLANPFLRLRVGLEYQFNDYWRVGGQMQDAHAPAYGRPAPASAQDPADLHEAYVEFGKLKGDGWGGLLGRRRFQIGSGNLIGLPEWSNAGRTYDAARVFWRSPVIRVEFLFASSVKFKADGFNKPVLGDRVWGMYHTLHKLIPGGHVDLLLLRHDQNNAGGFSGPGSLGTTSYGTRLSGDLPAKWSYDGEVIGQGGHIGPRSHRALGWSATMTRHEALASFSDWIFESKFASGAGPRSVRSATFDQLYPANHDRFGQADLVGWRNIVNVRLIQQLRWGKHSTIRITFTDNWLDDPADAMYDLGGRPISRSPNGDAGTHIGRELAVYTVHRLGHFQLGFGYAQWWLGEFVRRTTPGVAPRYLYFHQSFTF